MGGHSGRWAVHQVMEVIARSHDDHLLQHAQNRRADFFRSCGRSTIWLAPDRDPSQPRPRGAPAAEAAMAEGRLRALVATASLDLGLDWGDVIA
ncbi:hypothetical protein OVY29_16715 [Sphingopyxis sp. SE2]|uniref:hypothetical protein n=1 Tax=Sphingopyxis sp. SE2 TaxID=1586240 RepID=UPI0028C361CA|nr:hypothetical protein [Sphingopyxis sp. SE2]MDT7530304.1 hypothetical protein [Sphingopyxis sp. SE2]